MIIHTVVLYSREVGIDRIFLGRSQEEVYTKTAMYIFETFSGMENEAAEEDQKAVAEIRYALAMNDAQHAFDVFGHWYSGDIAEEVNEV